MLAPPEGWRPLIRGILDPPLRCNSARNSVNTMVVQYFLRHTRMNNTFDTKNIAQLLNLLQMYADLARRKFPLVAPILMHTSLVALNKNHSVTISDFHSSFTQLIQSWQKWQYWHQRI